MPDREHLYLRVAADVALLTVRDGRLHALTITRRNSPFRGMQALPGGFLRAGEDVGQAAVRELCEETGIGGERLHLEQLAVYSAPGRDPRGPVVSVAHLALAPDLPIPQAGSDAQLAHWRPIDELRDDLAFDHDRILDDAVERARRLLELTTLATAFCEAQFTIGDLRTVYEVVWGVTLDPGNFSRKVMQTRGFVEATGDRKASEGGRPAALYVRGGARLLVPPLLRAG